MENKIKRFLELSKEFTVKSQEVYEGFQENFGSIAINANGYYSNVIGECSSEQSSKAIQFEKVQLEKVAKVKRYEEYLQLQTDLLKYYTAKEKLNN